MKNPLTLNGIKPIKIIYTLARDEFDESIKPSNNYVSLKHDIIKALRKMETEEREENKLDTFAQIEHLKQNDFSNFISVRLAYWGMMIAVAVIAIGDVPIYNYFNMSKKTFGNIAMILLTVLLYTIGKTIRIQHDQLEYLNFKLLCFDEILGNQKNN